MSGWSHNLQYSLRLFTAEGKGVGMRVSSFNLLKKAKVERSLWVGGESCLELRTSSVWKSSS